MDVVLGLFAGNPAQYLQMLLYVDGHEALGCHIQVWDPQLELCTAGTNIQKEGDME